jgi:FtsP/CotA-like multicopper oxidase with cupredoxin domain
MIPSRDLVVYLPDLVFRELVARLLLRSPNRVVELLVRGSAFSVPLEIRVRTAKGVGTRVQPTDLGTGILLPMWTFNGQLPGPVIRARQGDTLRVTLKNSLPQPTTIHWHGVRVPNAMDGTEMTQTAVAPGATFTYEFVVLDEGTYWYHPHVKAQNEEMLRHLRERIRAPRMSDS